jgi:hypothetical protein
VLAAEAWLLSWADAKLAAALLPRLQALANPSTAAVARPLPPPRSALFRRGLTLIESGMAGSEVAELAVARSFLSTF